jgi:hypothetical protein
MKTLVTKVILICLIAVWGCGQHSHSHDEHDAMANDTNQDTGNKALYNEVMKIHDEVMPKMDDIYKLKEGLKSKIAAAPAMAEEEKKKIEATILKLDSASESMMEFMHTFKPLPDSLGEEQARDYLEIEMEKVKKVKEVILESIEEGKAEVK